MNTVLLADCASDEEAPRSWAETLRAVMRPDLRPRPAPSTPARDNHGSYRLAERLKAILDDNWTLIRGYANSAGQLDNILVGPHGVMTLACTALHGRIHCDGVHWQRDKFDVYNNLVERAAPVAVDPTGDLYAASACLQQVLLAQTSIRQVAMALVMTHPATTLGNIRHARLNMVTLLAELKTATLLQALSAHPDHKTIDGVVEVIRHQHSSSPRRRGPIPSTQKR